jgi:hypothetical protein
MIKEEYHIRSSGIHLQTVLLQRFVWSVFKYLSFFNIEHFICPDISIFKPFYNLDFNQMINICKSPIWYINFIIIG